MNKKLILLHWMILIIMFILIINYRDSSKIMIILVSIYALNIANLGLRITRWIIK